jgi:hypothetical protein
VLYHKSRTNQTLVNGKSVQHCLLYNDDTVQCGLLVFTVIYRPEGHQAEDSYVAPPSSSPHQQAEDSRGPNLFRQTMLATTITSTAELFAQRRSPQLSARVLTSLNTSTSHLRRATESLLLSQGPPRGPKRTTIRAASRPACA